MDAATLDLVARRSLPAAWAEHWASEPDRPVLHSHAAGWLAAGQLDARSATVAGRLHRAGLRKGDRIVISAATSIELVVSHVAALRLGLIVVPVNAAYRRPEIEHIVRDCRPAAVLMDDPERVTWAVEASDERVVAAGPDVALPDGEPAARPDPDESPPLLDAVQPSDPALIGYTSGTTGSPKGAVLTHGNLLASAEAVRLAWRWTERDRLVLALPLFHVHGLCVGLHGTLLAGASAVLLERFEPEAVLDAIADRHATLFFGVPTMYHRLAASPRAGELERLRLCVSGSAPLAAELFERLAQVSGQRVLERYGMTETLMNVSNPYDGERRPGSIGIELPGCEVRLAGDGEILLRGPNVFGGYWGNEHATAAAFDSDGWFHSGDLAARDDDGYLRILGRSKELIITGGYNVYPREVEEVLGEHGQVREVAVAGVPSEEWGETVTAFVVPENENESGNEPFDESALLEFAAERLASYKRPRAVHVVAELPRNALGKVLRQELSTRR